MRFKNSVLSIIVAGAVALVTLTGCAPSSEDVASSVPMSSTAATATPTMESTAVATPSATPVVEVVPEPISTLEVLEVPAELSEYLNTPERLAVFSSTFGYTAPRVAHALEDGLFGEVELKDLSQAPIPAGYTGPGYIATDMFRWEDGVNIRAQVNFVNGKVGDDEGIIGFTLKPDADSDGVSIQKESEGPNRFDVEYFDAGANAWEAVNMYDLPDKPATSADAASAIDGKAIILTDEYDYMLGN